MPPGAEAALCRKEGGELVGQEGDKVGVPLDVSSLFETLCLLSPNTEERYYPALLQVASTILATGGPEQQRSLPIPGDNSPK